MKESIKVFCRPKPILSTNIHDNKIDRCVQIISSESLLFSVAPSEDKKLDRKYEFSFDHVFQEHASQQEVFAGTIMNSIENFINGFNVTLMAYGQTNSGKTFTLLGDYANNSNAQNLGIMQLTASQIFKQFDALQSEFKPKMFASFYEIYNESLRDLLNIDKNPQEIKIWEKEDTVYLEGMTKVRVHSFAELMTLFDISLANRTVFATKMNSNSSRSHFLFDLELECLNLETNTITKSQLIILDLAGSEKIKKSHTEGKSFGETKNINLSLTELGLVIKQLSEKTSPHSSLKKTKNINSKNDFINFRNSILTRIIKNSLGKNSFTSIIINISSELLNEAETLSSLRFGKRAKMIKNKPVIKQIISDVDLTKQLNEKVFENQKLHSKIVEMEDQIEQLKLFLKKMNSNLTFECKSSFPDIFKDDDVSIFYEENDENQLQSKIYANKNDKTHNQFGYQDFIQEELEIQSNSSQFINSSKKEKKKNALIFEHQSPKLFSRPIKTNANNGKKQSTQILKKSELSSDENLSLKNQNDLQISKNQMLFFWPFNNRKIKTTESLKMSESFTIFTKKSFSMKDNLFQKKIGFFKKKIMNSDELSYDYSLNKSADFSINLSDRQKANTKTINSHTDIELLQKIHIKFWRNLKISFYKFDENIQIEKNKNKFLLSVVKNQLSKETFKKICMFIELENSKIRNFSDGQNFEDIKTSFSKISNLVDVLKNKNNGTESFSKNVKL